MEKELSEMTLEELWHLFPITLSKNCDKWEEYYEDEEKNLKLILFAIENIQIHHIGSTAIKGIMAKPIVDILIETDERKNMELIKYALENEGYLTMNSSDNRIAMNKGYTKYGFAERVFHLHIRLSGDNDELYFRDYLNEFSSVAKEYKKLKLQLWKKYEFDRDKYTESKSEFVAKYTEKAKQRYK